MNIRNKNWMVSLALLLSFSLAFPFCCHADISELFSHHQEVSVHASQASHQGNSDCKCGHELRQDFQKNKKQIGNTSLDVTSFTAADRLKISNSFSLSHIAVTEPFGKVSRPPLHLLYSVFLN